MSLLNIIRCDLSQNDYLVWKWKPEQGSPLRQNQIRLGSSLRVRSGEVAAFFYSTGGTASPIDYIEGPADLKIETKNLPVLANIIGMAFGGDSPFQAEVYFINKGQAPQLKWGVPYFSAFDPRFPDFPVPVAANGAITFSIANVQRFVEVQRLENFDQNTLREQILPQLRAVIKSNIVNLATARGIPLVQIGGRLDDLSEILIPTIAKVLEGFGIALRNFTVAGVEIDESNTNYVKLMEVTRDQVVQKIKTQGNVGQLNMEASQLINTEHVAESMRIQREQLEKRQQLQTETDYLSTHQVNLQADVAKTAASSLGHASSGGGGASTVLGGVGDAAISLGMGLPVGVAFGQQIVGSIQKTGMGALGGTAANCPRCNAPFQSGANFCNSCGVSLKTAPASVQVANLQIHIARGNQPQGIFALEEVNRRLSLGTFSAGDLGWHTGLVQWQPLATIAGVIVPPPLPSNTPPPLPPL